VAGQPVRASQPVEQPTGRRFRHRLVLDAVGGPTGHLPNQGVRVHAALGRLLTPSVIEGVRCLVLLGLAGGLNGPLDQPRRPLPTVRDQPVQLGVDLVGALREAANQLLGHSGQLAVAVAVRCRPFHPECPGQLALVGGSVDGVRGQPMPVQVPAVQRCPASVRSLDAVDDDQMGVQQRITLSGRPVVEPDRQHPLSGHALDTAVAAAGPQVLVQIADRLSQPSMMRLEHCPSGRRVTQAVEDRDALGRPQDHVEGGHGVAAMGATQELAGGGVAALEHGLEPRRQCFALQPKTAGASTVPAARGLPVARQILLVVGGQLAGVVRLPPHRELGDVGHHRVASLPAVVGASERTVVHCSPRTITGRA
jgi:hypothetical protein